MRTSQNSQKELQKEFYHGCFPVNFTKLYRLVIFSSLSVTLSLSVSLSVSLFLSLPFFLCLCLSSSLAPFLSLPPTFPVSLSLSLSLSEQTYFSLMTVFSYQNGSFFVKFLTESFIFFILNVFRRVFHNHVYSLNKIEN